MKLHTFKPENGESFRAWADVYQHEPYTCHVRIKSLANLAKFQGVIHWGRYNATVRTVEVGIHNGYCPCSDCDGRPGTWND
jgi:hypothetical protein